MIKKTSIKPIKEYAVLGTDTSKCYDPDFDVTLDRVKDKTNLSDLVKDINNLDKKSHEQIYIMLRRHKDLKFFRTDYVGTHINSAELDDNILLELYRTVKMCKLNNERKKVIESAHQEYDDVSKTFYERGTSINSAMDDVEPGPNPSEYDKLNCMVLMNETMSSEIQNHH